MNILEISAKLNIGGAQAVAANIARFADERFHFIYLVFGDEVGEYEAQIEAIGHKVIHIPSPTGNLGGYFRTLLEIMREEQIDVVHCHTMFNCGVAMTAAWLAGVKGRISHSHTIKDDSVKSQKRRIYNFVMRALIILFGTDYLACGVDAGQILYGKRWFSRHGRVIRNGIEIDRYRFNENTRDRLRRELGVEECFVIGHVGHYVHVKNQTFLLERMPQLLKQVPNARLLMFGDGPDRQTLQERIDKNGLADSVRLMGNADNIHELLSAFDVFAFPSLYEGTPLALIEAQANGLPCIISDAIPDDACLTDAVNKLPLDNADAWTDSILRARRGDPDACARMLAQRYGDICDSLTELYAIFDKYR